MRGGKKSGGGPKSGIKMANPTPPIHPAGSGSKVIASAKKRKRGGRIPDMGPEGKKAKMRLDRPGRRRGGRVGAEKAPLSSASKTANAPGHKAAESC